VVRHELRPADEEGRRGRQGGAVMAAKKKVTLEVTTDAAQVGGNTYPNGAQFEVSQAKAKKLLAAVIKAL